MKNYSFAAAAIFVGRGLVASMLLGLAGCASTPAQQVPPPPPKPRTVSLNIKNASIDELSNQLSQVKSSQVTVSTRALKALIMNQKTLQNQCHNLSQQLEAIKSLDIEEYENRE